MKIYSFLLINTLLLFFSSCAGDNPLIIDPIDKYLLKIIEVDNKLIAIGTEGRIYNSNDGEKWGKVDSKVISTLLDIYNLDNKNLFIVGEKGLLLKSLDSGNSWNVEQIPSNQTYNSVFFLDKSKGWAAGNNGRIFITNDEGNSWSDASFIENVFFTEIYFENNGFGFVTGSKDNLFTEPILFITNDFGQNWEEIDLSQYEIKGITQVKYFTNGFYFISANKIIYSNKSNKLSDFEIIFDNSIFEPKFDFTTYNLNNNEIIVAGYQGHNLGNIFNQRNNTYTNINKHILDMVKINSTEYYVGGYGYQIIKKINNQIDYISLE